MANETCLNDNLKPKTLKTPKRILFCIDLNLKKFEVKIN